MPAPSSSLTLSRTSLALADLVFEGSSSSGGDFGLISFVEPAIVPAVTYADSSNWVAGDVVTAVRLPQANLRAVIQVTGSTAAVLDANKAAIASALLQLSYTAALEQNGVVTTYVADPGSIQMTNDGVDLISLRYLREVYELSIPVNPLPIAPVEGP